MQILPRLGRRDRRDLAPWTGDQGLKFVTPILVLPDDIPPHSYAVAMSMGRCEAALDRLCDTRQTQNVHQQESHNQSSETMRQWRSDAN